MPSLTEMGEFINKVGALSAFFIATCVAIWRVGVFMSPLVTKMFEAHVSFLQSLQDNEVRRTQVLESQKSLLAQNTAILSQNTTMLTQNGEYLRDIHNNVMHREES